MLRSNIFFRGPGRYSVRLFINGLWRNVEVDDQFPVDKRNRLLCSHADGGSLFVSLFEKAFLKIHGGYQFPGSVASQDIYELIKWLPEDIYFRESNRQRRDLRDRLASELAQLAHKNALPAHLQSMSPSAKERVDKNALESIDYKELHRVLKDEESHDNKAAVEKERIWDVIVKSCKHSDCLRTAGTKGDLTHSEEEQLGLVGGHSYVILEAGEFEGFKLLLLRNPWRTKRWHGNFSVKDKLNWTPALKKKLNY